MSQLRTLMRPTILVPSVAVLATLAFLVARGELGRQPVIAHAALVRPSEQRGDDLNRPWRTGDEFSLQFDLARDGYPIVVHIGSRNEIEVLYPQETPTPLPRFGQGPVTLPPPSTGWHWSFQGAPGRETFLLAATDKSGLRAGALRDRLEDLHARTGDREALVLAASDVIARAAGRVERIDVEHVTTSIR